MRSEPRELAWALAVVEGLDALLLEADGSQNTACNGKSALVVVDLGDMSHTEVWLALVAQVEPAQVVSFLGFDSWY